MDFLLTLLSFTKQENKAGVRCKVLAAHFQVTTSVAVVKVKNKTFLSLQDIEQTELYE